VDVAERESRRAAAEAMLEPLDAQEIVAVATTFIDNSGITRVKAVPLRRLPDLAAWGVGSTPSFDRFRFDDWDECLAILGEEVLPELRRGDQAAASTPTVATAGR